MNRVVSRHEGTPTRCAYGVHIIVLQYDPAVSQSVDIRCGDLIGPMKAYIIPTLRAGAAVLSRILGKKILM